MGQNAKLQSLDSTENTIHPDRKKLFDTALLACVKIRVKWSVELFPNND